MLVKERGASGRGSKIEWTVEEEEECWAEWGRRKSIRRRVLKVREQSRKGGAIEDRIKNRGMWIKKERHKMMKARQQGYEKEKQ